MPATYSNWNLRLSWGRKEECLESVWESSVWVLAFYNLCFTNSHPLVVNDQLASKFVCVSFFSWWGWFSDMYACVNAFVLFYVLHLPIYDERAFNRVTASHYNIFLYIEIRTCPASNWKSIPCSFDFSTCGWLLPTFLLLMISNSFKVGFLNLKL